jgi:hypothetical protein
MVLVHLKKENFLNLKSIFCVELFGVVKFAFGTILFSNNVKNQLFID